MTVYRLSARAFALVMAASLLLASCWFEPIDDRHAAETAASPFSGGAEADGPAEAVVDIPEDPAPEADPADVESLDRILAALYDVISGPEGEERDWDRFRSLFWPGARLMPTGRTAAGELRVVVMSPREYAERAGPQLMQGFFEQEIGRRTERFGNVVHVFSAYAAFRTATETEPFMRGINSIQLVHDGTRFWVLSVLWDNETEANPLPERYLGTVER